MGKKKLSDFDISGKVFIVTGAGGMFLTCTDVTSVAVLTLQAMAAV